jgi:hypothetical protein
MNSYSDSIIDIIDFIVRRSLIRSYFVVHHFGTNIDQTMKIEMLSSLNYITRICKIFILLFETTFIKVNKISYFMII